MNPGSGDRGSESSGHQLICLESVTRILSAKSCRFKWWILQWKENHSLVTESQLWVRKKKGERDHYQLFIRERKRWVCEREKEWRVWSQHRKGMLFHIEAKLHSKNTNNNLPIMDLQNVSLFAQKANLSPSKLSEEKKIERNLNNNMFLYIFTILCKSLANETKSKNITLFVALNLSKHFRC